MAVLGNASQIALLKKDEEIASLRIENAMLHLKLAQMENREKQLCRQNAFFRRFSQELQQLVQSLMEALKRCQSELRTLKEEMGEMADHLMAIPTKLSGDIEQKMKAVFAQSSIKVRGVLTNKERQIIALETTIATKNNENQILKQKYEVEKTRRKALHNTLVEFRGNIRVHCRIRPLLSIDKSTKESQTFENVIFADDEETVSVVQMRQTLSGAHPHTKLFEFDRVFSHSDGQQCVFREVQPLLTSLLDGYNVCIMAYGQTGSGKTHTMLGGSGGTNLDQQDGIIPLAADHIFKLVDEKEKELDAKYELEVTVGEVYMERVRDLLISEDDVRHNVALTTEGDYDVLTLTSRPVYSPEDIVHLVRCGMRRRAEIATDIHEHSSRSHLIVTLTLSGSLQCYSSVASSANSTPHPSPPGSPRILRDTTPLASPLKSSSAGPITSTPAKQYSKIPRLSDSSFLSNSRKPYTHASVPNPPPSSAAHQVKPETYSRSFRVKLQLVDLAGSECVGMSGVTGKALRETQCINKSLSALSDVLAALAQHKSHVPYRNSTLTQLLKSSIGGQAKLMMMLCVSPSPKYVSESQRCLQFGSRARQIQRGPSKSRLK